MGSTPNPMMIDACGGPCRQAQLDNTETHVGCASLDDAAHPKEAYEKLLTDKERDRAPRFLRKCDFDRYILSLGILKTLIMDYIGVRADRLQFSYGPYGKPILDAGLGTGRLCFNMARSAGYALFAFARGRKIGVDIEQIREIPEMDQIVRLLFSKAEQEAFTSRSHQEKRRAFFDGWTRKEAFIKAIGVGLSMPLNRLAISLTPGNPVSLVCLDKDFGSLGQWTIRDVSTLPEFSAALAIEGSQCTILCRNFVPGMPV